MHSFWATFLPNQELYGMTWCKASSSALRWRLSPPKFTRGSTPGLQIETACGADEFGQFGLRQSIQSLWHQHAGGLQIRDCPLHIAPTCVLHQDGADTNLKRCLAGPPALMPKSCPQQVIGLSELPGNGDCLVTHHGRSQTNDYNR